MAEKEVFEYTYSAPQQSEVQKIREKYLPKEVTGIFQTDGKANLYLPQ